MTKFKITNGSFRAKAFKVHGGTEEVLPGKTRTIDVKGGLTDEFIEQQGLLGVKIEAVKNAEKASDAELKAVHRGGGSYSVMRGDEEVLEKLSKADAESFNAMSPAERDEYVKAPA